MHHRPNARARAVLFLCFTVALLAAVVPAAAHAGVEPNDLLIQAEGPLAGGTHTGVVANLNDWDWYSF